jgi:hypothetical protein
MLYFNLAKIKPVEFLLMGWISKSLLKSSKTKSWYFYLKLLLPNLTKDIEIGAIQKSKTTGEPFCITSLLPLGRGRAC